MEPYVSLREADKALEEATKHPEAALPYIEIAREKLRAILNLPMHVEEPAESLCCSECDASEDTLADAIKNGWEGIVFQPDGISYNYCGTCKNCLDAQRAEEMDRLEKLRKDMPF